jgi:hypothetical protein
MKAIIITTEEAIRLGLTGSPKINAFSGGGKNEYIYGVVMKPNPDGKSKGEIIEKFRIKRSNDISKNTKKKVKKKRIEREILYQEKNYKKERDKKGLDKNVKRI